MAATKNAQSIKKDTKEFLTIALTELLKKSPLKDITISQVVVKAGVSRMAFYRNFDTLEQILYEYYESKIGSVFEIIKSNSAKSVKLSVHLNFFKNFGEELILSYKHGYDTIIHDIFTKMVESFYGADDNDYRITFMAAGAYAVWKKWLLGGKKAPLEEVMRIISAFDGAFA
ncbi:MAG: TetR/AcrR family transcriptional regulator [Spirochaetes bacterium]|nr:TetR/AcrR family transcriptional regulator [Spirochaetota bacterium]